MHRHRDRNGSNHQRWLLSGTIQTRLGSIFCLIALLALFFLPLAHQCHLHTLEGPHAPLGAYAEQNIELQLSVPKSDSPHHAHHNAASCTICQAGLNSRYFAVPVLTLSPVLSLPIQRFSNNNLILPLANADILVSGPRAPPVSL